MSGEQLEKIETLDGQQFGKAGQFEELVERLALAIRDAYSGGAEHSTESDMRRARKDVRTVLAELAKMVADDALLNADQCADTLDAKDDVWNVARCVHAAITMRVAPILAAKDAELARQAEEIERLRAEATPTDEQLAEEAARFAYGSDWWDSGATDEDKRQCAEKALQIIRGIHGPKTEHALAEAVRAYANGARRSWRRSG